MKKENHKFYKDLSVVQKSIIFFLNNYSKSKIFQEHMIAEFQLFIMVI